VNLLPMNFLASADTATLLLARLEMRERFVQMEINEEHVYRKGELHEVSMVTSTFCSFTQA